MTAFAATPGQFDAQVEAAIRDATRRLDEALRNVERRSEIRAIAVDADECNAVLADLNIPADAQGELRQFCAEHPGGRLVIAYADYQPSTRRTTYLGGS